MWILRNRFETAFIIIYIVSILFVKRLERYQQEAGEAARWMWWWNLLIWTRGKSISHIKERKTLLSTVFSTELHGEPYSLTFSTISNISPVYSYTCSIFHTYLREYNWQHPFLSFIFSTTHTRLFPLAQFSYRFLLVPFTRNLSSVEG